MFQAPAQSPRQTGFSPRAAKHLEFLAAGSKYKERLFMAANRIGKTVSGAYEATCHLTGIYPDWWQGARFNRPTEGWACGTTSETTRDILQRELVGPPDAVGTGMIPGDLITHTMPRPHGMPGSLEGVWVRHTSGGISKLALKSYEQGRKSFEGTARDFIWCDEEPPDACYTEMLLRTLTTKGVIFVTFTPLQGVSEVVKGFLEPDNQEAAKYKFYVQAGWKDVPHLDEEQKKNLLVTTPRYQLRARTLGEPSLGSGAIYPISEDDIVTPLVPIPESWPRAFGMDVGWNRTAAIWGARDPGSGVIVLYDEHYQAMGEAPTHAVGIKARGAWIPGVIDPAADGRSQIDGRQLLTMYRELGLKLNPAGNSVDTGINNTWSLMVSGLLKVMPNCRNWLNEFRRYHRDEKGHIVKKRRPPDGRHPLPRTERPGSDDRQTRGTLHPGLARAVGRRSELDGMSMSRFGRRIESLEKFFAQYRDPNPAEELQRRSFQKLSDDELQTMRAVVKDKEEGICRPLTERESAASAVYNAALELECQRASPRAGRHHWGIHDMSNQTKTKSTGARAKDGRWKKGASGNPAGRPSGSRNKATLIIEQLFDGEAEDLCRKAINLAKRGSIPALRMCLDRLPARKERPIDLEMGPVQSAADLPEAFQRIMAAVSEGRITPGEAQAMSDILDSQARAINSADIERRVQGLEGYRAKMEASQHGKTPGTP
jgi:phage terminase large subunit-like protein